MALLNFVKQDLTKLRCCKCKGYLSMPPVTSTTDGFCCGRCVPLGEQVRQTESEAQAKYACRFNSFGCSQQVKFCNTQNHESTCEFRTTKCPISSCRKVKTFKSMNTHLVADHPNCVIKSPKLSIPQKKDVAMYHVLTREGMILLLQIRTRLGGKPTREFDLALKYFTKPPTIAQYTYSVKITSPENNKSLTIGNRQISAYKSGWNYSREDVESLDFNTLQMSLASNNFLFEIVLEKNQTKPSGAIKKTTNNDTNYNKQSTLVNQQKKTAASSGSVKEKMGDISSFLNDLECIICNEYMKPPIYLCQTGHSICSRCKKILSICPICKAKYEGARNFQLEQMTDRLGALTTTE